MKSMIVVLALALVVSSAAAQYDHSRHGHDRHEHAHGQAHGHSPYVDMTRRDIKALSGEQIAGLRAGHGKSLALPAEMNGYPGPSHVLELAEPLQLSEEQLTRTRALFEAMRREAVALGEQVIAAERVLDALFAEGVATPETLREATLDAARLHGELRALHLGYHLDMLAVLTEEQIGRYAALRGYSGT